MGLPLPGPRGRQGGAGLGPGRPRALPAEASRPPMAASASARVGFAGGGWCAVRDYLYPVICQERCFVTQAGTDVAACSHVSNRTGKHRPPSGCTWLCAEHLGRHLERPRGQPPPPCPSPVASRLGEVRQLAKGCTASRWWRCPHPGTGSPGPRPALLVSTPVTPGVGAQEVLRHPRPLCCPQGKAPGHRESAGLPDTPRDGPRVTAGQG